jgi:hypothetical protein
MSTEITFLPWLRRGLAQAITAKDPLTPTGLPRHATVKAWVDIETTRADQTLTIQGPDVVAGLAPAQVLREEPRADSADFEPSYFPFVELAAPDLPWMFTPASAAAQDKLRPWLVLVTVREQEGVTLTRPPGSPLPVLRIEAPADPDAELPDLAESWAWVHVHSLVTTPAIAGAVEGRTGEVVARLLSPRHLLPDSGWIACLVPAFDGGVARGRGDELPAGAKLAPAWVTGLEAVALPVYHSWRFTTGPSGTFESLCERLEPDGDGAEMGLHAMDIGNPGILTDAGHPVLIDMEGPLQTLEAQPRTWDPTHQADFQDDLIGLVDAGAGRPEYNAAAPDPVVAPPLYGCRQAGVTEAPDKGWVRTLNQHPARRAAAGLGARAVRMAQEALVAAAWDQAGDLRATTTALNRARLGVETGRSLARRASALADGDLLQLTAPLQAFLTAAGGSVRSRIAASAVPDGLVSAGYLRRTRPGTPLARDWVARRGVTAARLAADHTGVTVGATAASRSDTALEFADPHVPVGAWTTDATLFDYLSSSSPSRLAPAKVTQFRGVLAKRGRTRSTPPPAPVTVKPNIAIVATQTDVSTLATTVRRGLDPLGSVRASLLDRVPSLKSLLAVGELPSSVAVGPVFEDPMYWDLLALGSQWVMPGVGRLGANRVRLVEADKTFVGAFLIGAGHALGQELLWRGYPVDLRATFFHRFWDYVDQKTNDIEDLHTWDPDLTIRDNMGGTDATMTVIVIRGDVLRRYPNAHVFLMKRATDGTAVTGSEVDPDFLGSLDGDAAFFGFADLTPAAVRSGYFVGIEELAGASRFGLDEAQPAHFKNPPTSWNQVSWGHLVNNQAELDALTYARADNARMVKVGALNQTTWGFNSAHLARATWQRPFRMLIPADQLV